MKEVRLLVGNFELNPQMRPIWAWPNLFCPLKIEDHYKTQTHIFLYISSRATLQKRPLRLNIMAFCPERPK